MTIGKGKFVIFDRRLTAFLIMGVVLTGLTVLSFGFRQNQDIRSRASDVPFCLDKCNGQDRCGNGPAGDPAYNGGLGDPCCQTLAKTGNPFACPWPLRGYCTQAQCSAIPAGVNRQRCGGPRVEWCQKCQQAGCPGYGGAPQNSQPPQPTRPGGPTATPQPRRSPTPSPFTISPTPFRIPVSETPIPNATTAPNATPVIIYITTTPGPNEAVLPTNYSGQNLVNTPMPSVNLINPVSGIINTIQNLFSTIVNRFSYFTKTIAP